MIMPKAGKRAIDLAPELVHALKVWKLACPKGPLNLVFPTDDGTPKHRSTITHDGLRPALIAAKLHQVTVHSLRHTCASALILAGTDCLEVAKFLVTPSRPSPWPSMLTGSIRARPRAPWPRLPAPCLATVVAVW